MMLTVMMMLTRRVRQVVERCPSGTRTTISCPRNERATYETYSGVTFRIEERYNFGIINTRKRYSVDRKNIISIVNQRRTNDYCKYLNINSIKHCSVDRK